MTLSPADLTRVRSACPRSLYALCRQEGTKVVPLAHSGEIGDLKKRMKSMSGNCEIIQIRDIRDLPAPPLPKPIYSIRMDVHRAPKAVNAPKIERSPRVVGKGPGRKRIPSLSEMQHQVAEEAAAQRRLAFGQK